jgi:hypothetical protein
MSGPIESPIITTDSLADKSSEKTLELQGVKGIKLNNIRKDPEGHFQFSITFTIPADNSRTPPTQERPCSYIGTVKGAASEEVAIKMMEGAIASAIEVTKVANTALENLSISFKGNIASEKDIEEKDISNVSYKLKGSPQSSNTDVPDDVIRKRVKQAYVKTWNEARAIKSAEKKKKERELDQIPQSAHEASSQRSDGLGQVSLIGGVVDTTKTIEKPIEPKLTENTPLHSQLKQLRQLRMVEDHGTRDVDTYRKAIRSSGNKIAIMNLVKTELQKSLKEVKKVTCFYEKPLYYQVLEAAELLDASQIMEIVSSLSSEAGKKDIKNAVVMAFISSNVIERPWLAAELSEGLDLPSIGTVDGEDKTITESLVADVKGNPALMGKIRVSDQPNEKDLILAAFYQAYLQKPELGRDKCWFPKEVIAEAKECHMHCKDPAVQKLASNKKFTNSLAKYAWRFPNSYNVTSEINGTLVSRRIIQRPKGDPLGGRTLNSHDVKAGIEDHPFGGCVGNLRDIGEITSEGKFQQHVICHARVDTTKQKEALEAISQSSQGVDSIQGNKEVRNLYITGLGRSLLSALLLLTTKGENEGKWAKKLAKLVHEKEEINSKPKGTSLQLSMADGNPTRDGDASVHEADRGEFNDLKKESSGYWETALTSAVAAIAMGVNRGGVLGSIFLSCKSGKDRTATLAAIDGAIRQMKAMYRPETETGDIDLKWLREHVFADGFHLNKAFESLFVQILIQEATANSCFNPESKKDQAPWDQRPRFKIENHFIWKILSDDAKRKVCHRLDVDRKYAPKRPTELLKQCATVRLETEDQLKNFFDTFDPPPASSNALARLSRIKEDCSNVTFTFGSDALRSLLRGSQIKNEQELLAIMKAINAAADFKIEDFVEISEWSEDELNVFMAMLKERAKEGNPKLSEEGADALLSKIKTFNHKFQNSCGLFESPLENVLLSNEFNYLLKIFPQRTLEKFFEEFSDQGKYALAIFCISEDIERDFFINLIAKKLEIKDRKIVDLSLLYTKKADWINGSKGFYDFMRILAKEQASATPEKKKALAVPEKKREIEAFTSQLCKILKEKNMGDAVVAIESAMGGIGNIGAVPNNS